MARTMSNVPFENEVEAHHGGERRESVPGVDEADDRDHEERDSEHAVAEAAPSLRQEDGCRFHHGRREHEDPEQDRDRRDGRVLEAENDDREQEP